MAKYVYPVIVKAEDDGYSVSFPDFYDCYTQGENLYEAMEMAEYVLYSTLYKIEEGKGRIPVPTKAEDLKTEPGEYISLVKVDTIVYRKLFDNKAVKKTLSIPSWLNAMAEREEINFSSLLQKALKEEMNVQ